MADTMYTGFGIKLHWGPPAQANAIGFSETAFKRWQHHLLVGTRMLLYSTSAMGGTKEIHAVVEVADSFANGEGIRPFNEEHPRMLPVRRVHVPRLVNPVPLKRVREILGEPKWPRQGESWYPISRDTYETLLAELRGAPVAARTGYGIRVMTGGDELPATWSTNFGNRWLDVFSERAYQRWMDGLLPGTRMLLYLGSGHGHNKGITAVAMVQGRFIHNEDRETPSTEEWRKQWCWCLPVITTIDSRQVSPVPLERIREIIEPEKAGRPPQARFPRQGEVWRPISARLYETLMAEMLPD